ncbi:glycosyltransferase family 4 protein [uncultured Cytophaga sp.]|uniref:glycosyltransferase family 4 protein n=1 Tax=uncultured Cytophaga sp. TaxID=160238 RepID=UPI002627D692|nr:glycosyltransferase family 4 protein [uncultured Cytophaga sp.]
MNKNILLIWDRIGDYHLSRVKALEKQTGATVYTADLAGTDALYKWDSIANSSHTVLSTKPAEQPDILHRFKIFRKILKEHNIDFVAMPYGRTEYHLFLAYAKLTGISTLIFSESWYSRGKAKDFLKSILLKTLGDTFFVSGKRAYQHFTKNYHIKPANIISGYSVVDNAHFEKALDTKKNSPKELLCVARYSDEKNLLTLIQAFEKSVLSENYILRLVGDGPLRTSLQTYIDQHALDKKVILTGWLTYHELPQLYAQATAFILPSTFEPWGLVVNEAMVAGLPILLSNTCGCIPDLLVENQNGFSFDPYNESELTEKLNQLNTLTDTKLHQFGIRSKEIIQEFSPEIWARKMLDNYEL